MVHVTSTSALDIANARTLKTPVLISMVNKVLLAMPLYWRGGASTKPLNSISSMFCTSFYTENHHLIRKNVLINTEKKSFYLEALVYNTIFTVYAVTVAEWSSPHTHTYHATAWWSQPSQHHSMNQFSCSTKHIGANCPKLVSQITKETAIHLIYWTELKLLFTSYIPDFQGCCFWAAGLLQKASNN